VYSSDIAETYRLILDSEKALFESILSRLTAKQISLLTAIAKEPSKKLYAADYMNRHFLKSTGGIQRSLSVLNREDIIEKSQGNIWVIVDPLFRHWLVDKAL
jgi:DNA replication initiation complex subunit (GINS family)